MSDETAITDDYLDRLQAICDAATEGPWVVSNCSASWSPKRGGRCPVYFDGDNLQLAAASRTALPLLIAEIRRLKGMLAWKEAQQVPQEVRDFAKKFGDGFSFLEE